MYDGVGQQRNSAARCLHARREEGLGYAVSIHHRRRLTDWRTYSTSFLVAHLRVAVTFSACDNDGVCFGCGCARAAAATVGSRMNGVACGRRVARGVRTAHPRGMNYSTGLVSFAFRSHW